MMNLHSGRLPSVMTHSFSQVPKVQIPRSRFDRSHTVKTTFDSGYLVPFFVDEALPGDTFNLRAAVFARLATPKVPYMDNAFIDTFFFFVPNRLIWNNWEKFNGAQDNPGDPTDYTVPQIVSPAMTGWVNQSLYDYLSYPTEIPLLSVSALYTRAYNLIWNEWFRDENLQDSVVVDKDDGPDSPSDYVLLKRGKRHDYFTSCLPWPQKGPAVDLPLGQSAPVVGTGKAIGFTNNTTDYGLMYASSIAVRNFPAANALNTTAGASVSPSGFPTDGTSIGLSKNPANSQIFADLSEATAATINQLREAFKVQELYELDARGGTRYVEILLAHFGVVSPDARLQRPEYLGGASAPINVHPVPQTSETADTPQGNLAAFATASFNGHGFVKSFVEHGVVIGLVMVRADLTYQQGLNRAFSRSIRWDYYWPKLDELGEQAVLNKEIYTQGPAAINPLSGVAYDEEVFGYQERFAEYRYKPSVITGRFRSNYAQSLDIWHLSQDFGSLPQLNDEFIKENPPFPRVLVIAEGEPQFIFDSYIKLDCARPMRVYSTPASLGRF